MVSDEELEKAAEEFFNNELHIIGSNDFREGLLKGIKRGFKAGGLWAEQRMRERWPDLEKTKGWAYDFSCRGCSTQFIKEIHDWLRDRLFGGE